jgi:hypothetical protein
MKSNQIVSKIVKQAERRLIEIPADQKANFEKLVGKSIKVTIEEI